MKKMFLFLSIFAVAACATGGSTGLTKLTKEPKDCEYLYTMNTSVKSYDKDDVYKFIEQRILEDEGKGDSYFITEQNTRKNQDAVFGPKNTYSMKSKVYKCKK